MAEIKDFDYEVKTCSTVPLIFNSEICTGCGRCAEVCQVDILVPVKGSHPVIAYPGECYYCGACVMECPNEGAIKLKHPLMNTARFIPVINREEVE